MKTMYPAQSNSPGTEISVAITATATTVPVLDAYKLPNGPNLLTIGTDDNAETVLYTGKSGNSLTGCTRGFDGTTAQSWAVGSKVARYLAAYDINTIRENLLELVEFLNFMPINGGDFDGNDPLGPLIDGGTY